MDTSVVGREQELWAIESFLDVENGEPRTLLHAGEAGAGKTTLWRAGVDQAEGRSYGLRERLADAASRDRRRLRDPRRLVLR